MSSTARRPDRTNPLPLWAQVVADLTRRLSAEEFAAGLPAERDLIAEYGISRHTMREALRQLKDQGLISRERGRGTFASPATIEQRTGSLYSLFRSIEDQGFEQRSRVIGLDRRLAPAIAERLGLPADTALVYLHRLRFADTTPIATDELWLRADVAEPLLEVDFTHTAVYAELDQRCGVRPGAGWERVHPVMPSAAERALLEIPARQPAFLVERFTTVGGLPFEWRRTVIRGDRYAFRSSWGDGGATLDEPAFAYVATGRE
ncbi:MAG: GntR family transcriptional regulator [Acidimicrobiales bacterium]